MRKYKSEGVHDKGSRIHRCIAGTVEYSESLVVQPRARPEEVGCLFRLRLRFSLRSIEGSS